MIERGRFYIILIIFLTISPPVFANHVVQHTLCPKPLKIGWRDNPPFKIEDPSRDPNNIMGIDIELLRLMANDVGCEVKFINAPWARQLEGLKAGDIDIVSSASQTPERAQYAYFFSPYIRDTNALFMTAENMKKYQGKIKKFDDIMALPGFILGVTKGNYYGKEFAMAMQNPKFKNIVKEIKSDDDAVLKGSTGEVTGFLGDVVVTFEIAKKLNISTPLDAYPLFITNDGLYFAYSKKSVSPELANKLDNSMNKFINKYVDNGAFHEILSKYLTENQINMLKLGEPPSN